MLSDTSRKPAISCSMRASMRLRLSDKRSSSSPEPSTGKRPVRSPSMIVRARGGDRIDPLQQLAAHPIAAADAEQGHDAEPPQHGRADHARELPAVLDVAPDDQAIAASQPEHIGKSEPLLDAAGAGPAIDELDRAKTVGKLVRDGAEVAGDALPVRVGHIIETVAGRAAAVDDGADQAVQDRRRYIARRDLSARRRSCRAAAASAARSCSSRCRRWPPPPPRRTAQDRSVTGGRWWSGKA